MNTLKNKKALVTGGASGIGEAISKELAESGADLIIHYYKSKENALQIEKELKNKSNKVFIFQADLTDKNDIKKLVSFTKEKFGKLDILINNSGDMVKRINFGEINEDFYQTVMKINMDSMFFLTEELLPLLKDAGESSIVNLSSLAGRKGGGPGALVYAITKGAIISFTRTLATELASFGIRVNCVAPGLILNTKFHETHTSKEAQKSIIKGIPLGRAGNPFDVARAVVYLASEYSGFITGATLDINGGVYSA